MLHNNIYPYQVSRASGSPQDKHKCPSTVLPDWETKWTSAAGHVTEWTSYTVKMKQIFPFISIYFIVPLTVCSAYVRQLVINGNSFYLWSEGTEMDYNGWNRHDVNKERS